MKIINSTARQPAGKGYDGRTESLGYAGVHLLIELWQARYLDNESEIRSIIKDAIDACGATMLRIDLHAFSHYGGISGVAILKESHMSIHTWPELNYAAVDIFVCGTVDPHRAIPVIKKGFQPEKIEVMEIRRGAMNGADPPMDRCKTA